MTARKVTQRPQRDPAAVVAAFTYFEMSDLMGGDGAFTLALDSALETLEAACRCQTWGEFAGLVGYTWKGFVGERSDELAEIFEGRPRASEPFSFRSMWGGENPTSVIVDPRQSAFDFLVANVPREVLHDPRLNGLVEWSWSSPGRGIDAIECDDPKGFEVLEDVLRSAGFTGLTFKRGVPPSIFRQAGT